MLHIFYKIENLLKKRQKKTAKRQFFYKIRYLITL
jgi:hypothetical protein